MFRNSSAVLLPAAMLLAACGGSGGGSGSAAGSSPATAATPPPAAATPAPPAAAQSVSLTETEYSITPKDVNVKAGAVVFHLTDTGKFPHDLHIVDAGGAEVAATSSRLTPAGQPADVQATLKPGKYTMFCAVSNHRTQGMEGTITVT